MLGIIGGSLFFNIELFEGAKLRKVKTPYGKGFVFVKDNIIFLQRHGVKKNMPPHKIRSKINIQMLHRLGVEDIVSVTSVGSLKKDIMPGSIVIPDDYICLWSHRSFFENEIKHLTPELSRELREKIIAIANRIAIPVVPKGVYIETKGPRSETKAEISLLRNFGDVVGMTMVSEAVLAQELGMNYAAISSVNNYCNGIADEELTIEQIKQGQIKNSKKIIRILSEIMKEFK